MDIIATTNPTLLGWWIREETAIVSVPGQVYGISAVKHAIPSAEVVDKAVDLSLRIAAWAARPSFLKNISDKAVQKHGDIEVKPGMTIPVSRDGSYQQLQVNIANLGYLQSIIERSETNIQDVTGSNPFVAGEEPSPGNTTAFEVAL